MTHFNVARPVALAASLFSLTPWPVDAQHSGWQENQVNATMCQWKQPRVAVVKDTVYIDGGQLWWKPGMATGEFGPPTNDGNPQGLVFTLNFSTPFDSSQNLSTIFETISKAPDSGNANNIAPNYLDGAMLANDHQWFLYGGLIKKSDSYSTPPEDEVWGYRISSYGVEKPGLRPGFIKDELPDELTRYLTFGGAANAPSENKAWYFGGMVGKEGQEIFEPMGLDEYNPTNHSDTLIMLDMTIQNQETWHNMSLPNNIKGRANPEIVWVPVGEQGILVVLGGIYYPEFAQGSHKSANEAASKAQSDEFMSKIDIYDIANDKWYKQETVGGPTARTRGCAVMSPARDYSSFSIYWYGGYDGLDPQSDFDDDIWVLSLPSFIWTKVNSGSTRHGRAGHKCVMPYPDQMIVIGGYTKSEGDIPSCVEGGILEIANLTDGTWLSAYHPEEHHPYGIPEKVHLMIGGDWEGGATISTPTPTGWSDPDLANVFAKAYPTDKITKYYPYAVDEEVKVVTNENTEGWPTWATPVLVVLLILVISATGALVWFIFRRRKQLGKHGGTQGNEESGNRIISWIRGQSSEKAATVTTEETPSSPMSRSEPPFPSPSTEPQRGVAHEMPDTSVAVEMMDTSPRAELDNTGLSHTQVIDKHTHFGSGGYGSLNNPPSFYSTSGVSQTDHASVNTSPIASPFGGVGALNNAIAVPRQQPAPVYRPDSPSLGALAGEVETPINSPPRIVSVSSGFTTTTSHIRDESVSTMGDVTLEGSRKSIQSHGQVPTHTPVSPPQPVEEYAGAKGTVSPPQPGSPSPLRRSVFLENQDDMGEPSQEPPGRS